MIVRGTQNNNSILKATFIPTEAVVLEGDKIETSGLGGIYPKGIHIGTIKQVVSTKNITDRYALIQTAVDFSKLETVLVIKYEKGTCNTNLNTRLFYNLFSSSQLFFVVYNFWSEAKLIYCFYSIY